MAPGTLTSIVNAINSAHIPEVTAAIYNSALMITDATAANLVIVNIAGKALTTLGLAAQTYTATLSYSLVDNDLWIDTSDLENYPMIYRYAAATSTWTLIDNTDHTTPFGIIFDDARQDSGAPYLIQGVPNTASYTYYSRSIFDMMLSDYVDPDAPNADAHPAGVIMFNTRYATGDVKVWTPNYFKAGGYDPNTDYTLNTWTNGGNPNVVFQPLTDPDRWVSASGLATDLTAYMLRKAQRQMVVKAMIAEVENNQDIRSELVYFNLMTAPGYPELMSTMVTLNTDQNDVSFIVGDTPIRLPSNGTAIQNWAKNAGNVAATGEDGLTLSDNYVGIYYPWGLGTDLSGNEVMIPPSTVALVTIGYNDQVAYPWFAPAGFNRGLVSNATSVGYLANDGTYKPVILNQGQRDVLYTNQINPIAYIPGRGLVVYGQKTLGAPTSMLDRINVARLCNYIAYNLDLITKPYLFEQNDSITQKAATNTVSSFFNSLVGLRAISDYGVLCDSTNNTPDRVAANQLWIDCFVVPISAVEFIYIPVRILISTAASVSALGKPV